MGKEAPHVLQGEGHVAHCGIKWGTKEIGVSHFRNLKKMIKKLSRKARTAAPWISNATLRLADQRTVLGQTHTANQQE